MTHVVQHPAPPFPAARGLLRVHQVPAWRDNLVWVLVTPQGGAWIVDGPDAEGALALVERSGWTLRGVLNTHTHADHVGVNRDLARRGLLAGLEVVGPAADAAAVPGLTRPVDEGDEVDLGGVRARVLRTDGHLHGHVSYVVEGAVFCGDTLFTAGCGRLFTGPPSAMWTSLRRLAALPEDTRVCCAHEYTRDNLRFAWYVEPGSPALAARIRSDRSVLDAGGSAVPSTIGLERATNPFLRPRSPRIRTRLAELDPGFVPRDDLAVFTRLRELKDRGVHRTLGDADLPLA